MNTPLRRSGMARVLKWSHSFTCTPHIHLLTAEMVLDGWLVTYWNKCPEPVLQFAEFRHWLQSAPPGLSYGRLWDRPVVRRGTCMRLDLVSYNNAQATEARQHQVWCSRNMQHTVYSVNGYWRLMPNTATRATEFYTYTNTLPQNPIIWMTP